MIIDAEGIVLGRLASFVAKKALLGDEKDEGIVVVNAEKAIVSGRKRKISEMEQEKRNIRNLGTYRKGPFHYRRPDKMVRRAVRGMLPYKAYRGKNAYKRVMVYIGVPEEAILKNHSIDLKKTKTVHPPKRAVKSYMTVGELCKSIGGKW